MSVAVSRKCSTRMSDKCSARMHVAVPSAHIETSAYILVAHLRLTASCTEYRLFYRAFLQKSPIILMSLLIVVEHLSCIPVATHCIVHCSMRWLRLVGSLNL